MAIEAIKGAGMAYQGSSSTAEVKKEVQPRVDSGSNEITADHIAKDTMAMNIKETRNQSSDDKGQSARSQSELQKEQMNKNNQIRKAVEEINKSATGAQSEAIFGIHEKTNRVTIKIVDKKSKEVIKEYPPEKTLDMIAKVWEMAGIMVDEKR